jgi:hypothetical protein
MAEKQTYKIEPYVEHTPDAYTEQEAAEGASWPLGGGFTDVGFIVNGAKISLKQFKSPAFDKLIALAAEKDKAGPPEAAPKP